MAVSTTRKPATKAAAPATTQSYAPRRLSLGTAFETSNSDFFAGPVSPAEGQYQNQQALLDMLGEPAEGYQWRIKAWVKEGKKQRLEIAIHEEPIQAR